MSTLHHYEIVSDVNESQIKFDRSIIPKHEIGVNNKK